MGFATFAAFATFGRRLLKHYGQRSRKFYLILRFSVRRLGYCLQKCYSLIPVHRQKTSSRHFHWQYLNWVQEQLKTSKNSIRQRSGGYYSTLAFWTVRPNQLDQRSVFFQSRFWIFCHQMSKHQHKHPNPISRNQCAGAWPQFLSF